MMRVQITSSDIAAMASMSADERVKYIEAKLAQRRAERQQVINAAFVGFGDGGL